MRLLFEQTLLALFQCNKEFVISKSMLLSSSCDNNSKQSPHLIMLPMPNSAFKSDANPKRLLCFICHIVIFSN